MSDIEDFRRSMDEMFGPEVRCEAGQTEKPTRETCTRHAEHHWCSTCAGWYGVRHDFGMHDRGGHHDGVSYDPQCACRMCRNVAARLLAEQEDRDLEDVDRAKLGIE